MEFHVDKKIIVVIHNATISFCYSCSGTSRQTTADQVAVNCSQAIEFSSSSEDEVFAEEDSEERNVLFPEDIVESVILNWVEDCPNVPKSAVSKLLSHFNDFYPDLPKTAHTLLKSDSVDVSIVSMHFGRYIHFNNWRCIIAQHLNERASEVDHLSLDINIDGTPLFRDSRRFHAHPILVKLNELGGKIICPGIYVSEKAVKKTTLCQK